MASYPGGVIMNLKDLYIEFFINNNEVLILPGQILLNSDEVYRKTVEGKLPFVKILEEITLNSDVIKCF